MTRKRSFFLTSLAIVGAGQIYAQSNNSDATIDDLIQAIKGGNVNSIEIIGVPLNSLYRTNISPKRLDELWDYKLLLRDVNSYLNINAEEFVSILRSARIHPYE